MNTVKKLPLAMAVVAAPCPISVMAQEFTQVQIDAIVAKAVDKALADRQAKIDAAANKKVDVINSETTAASPDMAIPFGLKFSGYARDGAHFQTGAPERCRRRTAPITAPRRSAVWVTQQQRRPIQDQQGLQKSGRGLSGILRSDVSTTRSDEANLKKAKSALPTC